MIDNKNQDSTPILTIQSMKGIPALDQKVFDSLGVCRSTMESVNNYAIVRFMKTQKPFRPYSPDQGTPWAQFVEAFQKHFETRNSLSLDLTDLLASAVIYSLA